MTEVTTIGLDIARNVSQLHGFDGSQMLRERASARLWDPLDAFGSPREEVGALDPDLGFVSCETLGNITQVDIYLGRGRIILSEWEKIKRQTIEQRRLHHRKYAA